MNFTNNFAPFFWFRFLASDFILSQRMKYNRKIKRMNSIHSETLILTPSVRWVCKSWLASERFESWRTFYVRKMRDHLHNSYRSRASAITHGYGSTQSTNFGRRQSLMSSVTIGTDRPRSKLVTRKSEIILTGKKQSIIVAKKVRT